MASLFHEVKESGTDELPILSVSIHNGISDKQLEEDERDRKVLHIEDHAKYSRIRPGDIAYNMMRAWQGAFGAAKVHGLVSPAYVVARSIIQVDSRYFDYLLRSDLFASFAKSYSKGITDFRLRLYWEEFRQIEVYVPPIYKQSVIADFLDCETVRIDQLIEKKQRFLSLASKRVEALVDGAISDRSVSRIRFENVVQRVQRPVTVSDHEELIRLGLYNRGRGIFKKPAASEEDIGVSDFFFVEAGDLILSGQFAWEGAVALATEEETGCVVSHRYPVYKGRNGVKTGYLLGLLRSSFGDFLLNEASRGSAGRNRPLNTWRLGKEKIPVPNEELQEAVERAIDFERRLKKKTEESIALLSEFRAALITAAVTGQIDVTTWGKRGETNRRLDGIEEEIQLQKVRA